jgi:apolipoprotein N-acyltransferase
MIDSIGCRRNKRIQANISQSLKLNRESLRNYYIQLMEEEKTQAENDMNSGNTVGAITHKMQADMVFINVALFMSI